MAPFRRGKRDSRSSFQTQRGRSVTGRDNRRGGRSHNGGPNTASSTPFQASRVDEAVNDGSEASEVNAAANEPVEEAEGFLTLSESSDSDAGLEKPYNLLLKTLKPEAPRGEPKRKRRKVEPIETPLSAQAEPVEVEDALEELQDQAASSDEDTGDESAEDDITEGRSSRVTGRHDLNRS